MSIQKYEAFIKTVELGSFKKAAEALGYTQAGISYMLNTLETDLDLTLFVRDYGGVQLTANGKDLLPWIQEICNSERRFRTKLVDLKNLESGTLRVAAFTSVAIQWLPSIMQSFQQEYPNIKFELRCSDDQAETEQLVWRGDVDCGFFVLPAKPDLFTIPLKRDPLLIALPANHPLSESLYFPIDSLAKFPYIELDEGSFSEMRDVFKIYGIKPNIAFKVENSYAAMALVSKGFGFSIFPELFLQGMAFPMISKELEIPAYRELAIAIRSQETASLATKTFVRYVEEWVHTLE